MSYTRHDNESLEDYVSRIPKSEIIDAEIIGGKTENLGDITSKLTSKVSRFGLNLWELTITCGGIGLITGFTEGKGYKLAQDLSYIGVAAPTLYVGGMLDINLKYETRKKIQERLDNLLGISLVYQETILDEKLDDIKILLEKEGNKKTKKAVILFSAAHLGLNYGAYCFGRYLANKY